jgi:glycosyltransferase involved in cell wall biosynthesis
MRLAIFSDCVHVSTLEGKVGSDVHIFVRQIEALSLYFSEILLCCPFVQYDSNIPITTYQNSGISFMPLEKVGGATIASKLKLIKQLPVWFKAYKKADALSDIVYQRFPNNINLPGFFYFYFINKKVFATYTGTWEKNNEESITYTFQKWLLRNWFKGPVGVYSNNQFLSKNIFSSFSPSYCLNEWNEELENVAAKVNSIKQNGLPFLSMITVGSFVTYKNQQYILNTCLHLKKHAIPFHLYMVGDGELRQQYERYIKENNLIDNITLTGKIGYNDVRVLYRKTNFVIQAPTVEGFGKVPIEGYFHGTIPIINNISLASYLTQQNTLGYLFSVNENDSLFNILIHIFQNPSEMIHRIESSRLFAQKFTLENWANEYYQQIKKVYPEIVS